MTKKEFIEKESINFKNQMDPEMVSQFASDRQLTDNDILLSELINNYYEDKISADHFKKICDEYNSTIKTMFNEMNINEFETDTKLKAKLSTQKRESFNEDLLLNKLKELGAISAIKTKEFVDMDELENLIYNGKLDASELSDCRIIKEIQTLKITKMKGE